MRRDPGDEVSPTPTPADLYQVDLDERPWAAFAACREADPEIFFGGSESDIDAAVRICKTCAVAGECLDWALDMRIRYGVWGGATERERRRILRRSA